MAGIYPDGGVSASDTTNGVDVNTTNSANEKFYPLRRCNPRFDPAATNALISEVLQVVSKFGRTYDHTINTNLYDAIKAGIPTTGTVAVATATATGTDSFSNPIAVGDQVLTVNSGQTLVVAKAKNASLTVRGQVELATADEIRDATENGGTGAPAVMTAKQLVQVDTFTGTYARADDRIYMRDNSTGKMYWVDIKNTTDNTITNMAGTVTGRLFSA
jgi:hypothetical protein